MTINTNDYFLQSMQKTIIDFFKLLSWDKSFQRNVWIGNPLLNRLGLHVGRVIMAHALFRWRLMLLSLLGLISSDQKRQFIEQGVIVIHDFLERSSFVNLKQELINYEGNIRDVIEGSTLTQRVYLDQAKFKTLPESYQLFSNTQLINLLRFCSSKNRYPLFYIENIKQHFFQVAKPDPQKDLHADTFHPSVKAWLFIDEVSSENGAFTYVPTSNRLTLRRLIWEYHESNQAAHNKHAPNVDRYWDGSFRIDAEKLAALGYEKPIAVEVPANSLVIANTFAFHCRGNAIGNKPRMAIWMQMRDNPFNPFPTPTPKYAFNLYEIVWGKLMKKRDAELTKSGELVEKFARFER